MRWNYCWPSCNHLAFLVGLAFIALIGTGRSIKADPAVLPTATASLSFVPGHIADPTPAWLRFCNQNPECNIDLHEPSFVSLTQERWQTMVRINQRVNAMITPVTDQEHWGVEDRWDYPNDGKGDCEDIQLMKRALLVEAGFPIRALRMTVVIDELGAGHAVLMIRTDRGDFILDNKHNAVLPWQRTGYDFVKREGSDNRTWLWLGLQRGTIVTAAQN